MIIDKTYFTGDIRIPNVTVADSAVGDHVEDLINKYEPEFLLKVLGYTLYKAFTTGLSDESIEQHWKDLRDGVEYTDSCGALTKWRGLITLTGETKQSLIANYVYYWYMRGNETQTTSGGEKVSKMENAAQASASAKVMKVWNEMCFWLVELFDYLEANKTIYPDWKPQPAVRNLLCKINVFNI